MLSRSFAAPAFACLLLLAPADAQQRPRRSAPAPERSAVVFPDTVAGRQTQQFLEAFNSGRYEAIETFYRASSPAAAVAGDTAYSYAAFLDSGGLDIVGIDRSSDFELVLTARERVSRGWATVRFQYDRAPPYNQTAFGVGYIYPPGQRPRPGSLPDSTLVRQTEALMQRLSRADIFSGSLLVAHNGRIIFNRAYGLANRGYGVPNRVDTRFNIGSVVKLFTAVAILQLAQEGRLSLDDHLGRFLPDYPNRSVRDIVTVRQLLTHRSGIGRMDRLGEQGLALRNGLRSVDSWLPLFAERPPLFAPGTSYRYSNEGYILLGAIVECASGQNYYDYVQTHVFERAGMSRTGFFELDSDTPNLATGYTRTGVVSRDQLRTRRNNLLLNIVKGAPSGGAYSTGGDLLRFQQALFANRLTDAAHTRLLTTGQAETGEEGARQAFGLEELTIDGVRLLDHSGAVPGGEARFEVYPDLGYVVISLANVDYQVVHRRLRDMIIYGARD